MSYRIQSLLLEIFNGIVSLNFITGIYSFYLFHSDITISFISPVFNLINGIFLYFIYGGGIIKITSISDDDAKLIDIIILSLIILTISIVYLI